MPAPRILFVKLSSLGDVVHHFPAVTDLRAHLPRAHIAWAVEEAYAPLVALHPAVDEIITVPLRALRKRLLHRAAWQGVAAARRALRESRWDQVVDTQGLIKSGLVAAAAAGHATYGPDRRSAREGAAALFYGVRIAVPRGLHAVERNRRLVAQAFGYALQGPARYGLAAAAAAPAWAPASAYAVLLHAASRERKRWPEEHWLALGRRLAAAGVVAVFPGGTEAERADSARLAKGVPGAVAAPAMDLAAAASLLARAACVAGVDTGLTHLAVALGRPTVGIYGATRPELTGLHGPGAVNLGGPGAPPSVDAVAQALGLPPAP